MANTIFQIASSTVLLGWALLIFFPKFKYTQPLILNVLLLVFAALYAYLILKNINDFSLESFSSIEKIRILFNNDEALTAGWLHYLAFDLFVGAYIVKEGIKIGMPRWQYTIALPFTFMFGPMGYLIFSLFIIFGNKK